MQVNSQLIRSEREKRAWSQSHLADVSGLGLRTIQRIETGGRASYESASAIATAFSMDVSVLLAADAGSIPVPRSASAAKLSKRVTVAAVAVVAAIASLVWILDAGIWKPAPPSAQPGLEFSEIGTVNQLDAMLAEARAEGRPVMIYVTADWCVACRSIEAQTFRDSAVSSASEAFLALRVDVTANSADDMALLSALDSFGPPTISFFDGTGAAVRPVVGFVSADEFRNRLAGIAAM